MEFQAFHILVASMFCNFIVLGISINRPDSFYPVSLSAISIAGKLGANYSINNNMVAYVNIDSRFSNLIRGTYGASVGLKLNF